MNDSVKLGVQTSDAASDNVLSGKGEDIQFATSGVLHRSLHEPPLPISHGSGIWLYLQDGRKILDATCGAAVSCLGHGHPAPLAAMADQMSRLSYCHTLFFGTEVGEQLADSLLATTEGKMSKVWICNSGSEAMEAAMKLSRQYFLELTPRPQEERVRFIARRGSYHGTTLGALGVGYHAGRRKLYEPILSDKVSFVSACNAYRGMEGDEDVAAYVKRLAEELDQEFQRVSPNTVCAFVAEPVVGAALGCVPYVPGYFKAIKEVCDRYGALLIFDEVMSGMGRCGHLNAWQNEDVGIVPDIQTIGKGLGGGYAPVAGLMIGERVVRVLDKGTGAFQHGQTYQGHPISCAAALAVNKIIRQPELMAQVRTLGKKLEHGLRTGLDHHPHVGNIRGKGLFWGIEFVKDKKTKEPFDPKLQVAMSLHEFGMKEPYSMSIYPGSGTADGTKGDHVLLSPAYVCTEDEIDLICQTTVQIVNDYFKTHHTLSKGLPVANGNVTEPSTSGRGINELYRPEDGSLLPAG